MSPASLEGLYDSPYAAELRKARPAARFAPAMEADYLRAFLRDNRTLVRLSCTLAVLLMVLRAVEVLIGNTTGESSRPAYGWRCGRGASTRSPRSSRAGTWTS